MNDVVQTLDRFVEQQFDTIIRAAIALFAFAGLIFIAITLQKEVGFEPVWIARSIAEGQGYSFPLRWAWLCTPLCEEGRQAGDYLVTAWADPMFSLLYGSLIALFGEETSRIIIRLLHLGFFCAAAVLTALTARRIAGPWAGLIAFGFLLVATKHHATTINAAPIATLWIALIAYWLVHYGNELTVRRAIVLGGLLGVSALTWGSTIIFIPFIAAYLVVSGRFSQSSLIHTAAVVVLAAAIISPWTIRNYIAFGEFVPVRNGIGQVAWIGTIGAASTYSNDDLAKTEIPVPWTSNGPGDAIRSIIGKQGIRPLAQLEGWQEEIIDTQIDHTQELNEAVRDKWLFSKARHFLLERPVTAMQLAFFKVNAFIMRVKFPVPYTELLSIAVGLVTYFGLVAGTLLTLRYAPLWPATILVAGFMAPFAIITPYYYRYRQPIEPMISIMVAVSIVLVFEMARRHLSKSSSPNPTAAQSES